MAYDDEKDEEEMMHEDTYDSHEEAFMHGYKEKEDDRECAECFSSITDGKEVVRELDEETYYFCSESCAKDFEDSMN